VTKPVTAVLAKNSSVRPSIRSLRVCETPPGYLPKATWIPTEQEQKVVSAPPVPPQESSNWKKLNHRRELGVTGESAVIAHYIEKGYTILERNWRAGRYAEIDLIARDRRGTLIFVEVKTRIVEKHEFGFVDHGFNAIHSRKRRKILTAGRSYAAHHANPFTPCRFDVVVVEFTKGSDEPRLIHIPDAFHA
jgi:putative endonuclease